MEPSFPNGGILDPASGGGIKPPGNQPPVNDVLRSDYDTKAMLRRLLLLTALPLVAQCQQAAIKPTTPIRLFDGKTLDNFDMWQQDNHQNDPDKVFSVVDQVDGAPAIRISGQHWGGLITKSAYRDYKLVAEFRWGLLTWGQRKD